MRLAAVASACVAAVIAVGCSPGDQDQPDAIAERDVPFQLLDTTSTTTAEPASPTSSPVTLYFVAEDRLVPVARLSTRRVNAGRLLDSLLEGPTADETAIGITTAIPSGTRVSSTHRSNGTLVVELSSDLGTTDSTSALAVGQLVLTAAGAPDVDEVRFEIDGKAVQVPKGDGTLADGPVTAADYRELQTG